ncbi:Alpha-galactosidase mel1 [Glycine soja]
MIVSSQNAITPPRGWNSYDSFSWIISEEEYLQNANIISQKLLPYGYQYAIVDYLWYRSLKGDSNSLGFDMIDKWGRMLPDPERWPSSRGGGGFTEVANKVHSMGLKFGIHLMAGISTQAYNKNTPILDTATGQPYMESGRVWNAKDIGIPSRACKWMTNGFMAINAKTGAGKAFLRSIYELYASWGVDFVKLDCVFGEDLDLDEITFVSEFFNGLERPIVFSLSPGVSATPLMANSVSSLVNTYRVTGDDWDEWSAILVHFNVARDFATSNLIGGKGLKGETYVAFFNLNNEKTTISASIVDLAMVHPGRRKFRLCSGNEMWSGRTIQTNNMFSAEVQGHGCALFVLQCSRICPKILFEYLLFIFQVTVMFWFVFCQVMVV